jgi:uncharacterized membrane protein YcaP (DUF421 family)
MIENTTPLAEVVLRVGLVYVLLVAMIRLSGKREVGRLSPLDLLGMLLLAETVSPALTAQDRSLSASLVAAATLLAVAVAMGRLTKRSRRAERWIDGTPVVIARDGRTIEEAMDRERITRQELESAIRKNNLEHLADVRIATVEPDGSISVVPRDA